jgi:hypothetical protein
MKLYLAVVVMMAGVLSASADLATITITGDAKTTEKGYTQGQSYSFSFTVSDLYVGGSEDIFFRTYGPGGWTGDNLWKAGLSTDPALLASLTGDNMQGFYTRPGTTVEATFEYISARQDEGDIAFRFQNEDQWNSTIGLMVDGKPVNMFYANYLDIPGLDASEGSFVNPVSWLSDYAGTYNYTPTGGWDDPNIHLDTTLGGSIDFAVTSLTIEAVPEPATAMMLFFGSGIGFVIHRARRWANR